MSEVKRTSDRPFSSVETSNTLAFDPNTIKAELSFFLKQPPHELPPITVKYLVDQFALAAKASDDAQNLRSVLCEAATTIRFKRGELSPGYLAFVNYAKSKGVDVLEKTQPEVAPAPTSAAVQTNLTATAQAAGAVLAGFPVDEAKSTVRPKTPDIMSLSLDDAIRAYFPSIPEMVLQAFRLKLIQGPDAEEAGTYDWVEKFFVDAFQRFPRLQDDIDRLGISVGFAGRTLFGRAQLDANRAAASRSQSRGRLDTLVGVEIPAAALAIAVERTLAGLPLNERSAGTPPADTSVSGDAPEEDPVISIHDRETFVPEFPGTPHDESNPHERDTVTFEAAAPLEEDKK